MLVLKLKQLFSRLIMEVKVPHYLLQPKLYQLSTKVVHQQGDFFEFQDSIFHLQGGGQPNDKGWILYQDKKFDILGGTVDKQTGTLKYKLPAEAELLPVGGEVQMVVDADLRQTHAKIHSAGHILDLAVQRLKYPWQAGKGYHFTDGPYVQYKGVIDNGEKAMHEINNELKLILQSKVESVNKIFTWQQAVEQKIIPETFKTSYVRVIYFGESSCPCGGTHVDNVAEIQELQVLKVQKKGKNVRVYYKVL